MMHRTRIRQLGAIAAVVMTLAACGGGGDVTPPIDVKPPLVDPYATVLYENTTTAAAGRLQASYLLYLLLPIDLAFPVRRVASQGSIGPGEISCVGYQGFVGEQLFELVAVTDTLSTTVTPGPLGGWRSLPDSLGPAAARGELALLLPGLVRRTTGSFDPLVSADTSRGHTRERPVKWRWTISDAGVSFREDSTTTCNR